MSVVLFSHNFSHILKRDWFGLRISVIFLRDKKGEGTVMEHDPAMQSPSIGTGDLWEVASQVLTAPSCRQMMLAAQAGDASVLRDQDEPFGTRVMDDTLRKQFGALGQGVSGWRINTGRAGCVPLLSFRSPIPHSPKSPATISRAQLRVGNPFG